MANFCALPLALALSTPTSKAERAAAVVGAGWDPGALSLLRGLALVLAPRGHTKLRHHVIGSLYHTLAARSVPGVRTLPEVPLAQLLGGAGFE